MLHPVVSILLADDNLAWLHFCFLTPQGTPPTSRALRDSLALKPPHTTTALSCFNCFTTHSFLYYRGIIFRQITTSTLPTSAVYLSQISPGKNLSGMQILSYQNLSLSMKILASKAFLQISICHFNILKNIFQAKFLFEHLLLLSWFRWCRRYNCSIID